MVMGTQIEVGLQSEINMARIGVYQSPQRDSHKSEFSCGGGVPIHCRGLFGVIYRCSMYQ